MKIGARDEFEHQYMARFENLAAPYGIFVEYKRDRAGRDIGLHLTQPAQTGDGKITSQALLWFQMKGVMAGTLSKAAYEAEEDVPIDLDIGHLRFWYMNLQPTYLAVYVESADQFLAIDIKKWVADHYGDKILTLDQQTVRVRVDKKNALDEQFFRIALEKNLIPVLRRFAGNDDAQIARFLRDSAVVKRLADTELEGRATRLTVIKWMSKMRTEVYFESETDDGEWEPFRTHWQYSMGDLSSAFPYLAFVPAMTATFHRYSEVIDDFDGVPFEVWHESFSVENTATGEEVEDDELDGECLLELGDGTWSYGEMGGGELIEHCITVSLNEVGKTWAANLQIMIDAEVLSVDVKPQIISVAPWHARDL